ncbi:hypothetical protein L211DRAFT_284370 [Terfezia boudieri ATCC MYA-4762]|uniref:Uncharacterized protein n=1 Tax=Terfezia boudieri ATCC MYA-4762 TaxID=1051890 RepID=A0A3N4LZ32_9PEZI|nr:hypothetical protein L211DRAFT_284370 [Terfezia boudieri ATCC MYA-4762]
MESAPSFLVQCFPRPKNDKIILEKRNEKRNRETIFANSSLHMEVNRRSLHNTILPIFGILASYTPKIKEDTLVKDSQCASGEGKSDSLEEF